MKIKMRGLKQLIIGMSVTCVSTLAQAEEVNLSMDDAWDAAVDVLLDLDAYPSTRDKDLSVIKTDAVGMQLDKSTADCGKMFGISYIRDKRTKTSVAYQLRFKKVSDDVTDIRVKAKIDGYFFTNETSWAVFLEKTRDASKVLQCKSTGELEKQFVQLVRDAA